MEKLLALHEIKKVQFSDSNDVERSYAFTAKMSSNDIFIEYYTVVSDTIEEDMEETNDVETSGDMGLPEHGSRLSVVMRHHNKYYEFLLYHDTIEIGFPVMLLQTIIFLVNLIDRLKPDDLIEYLSEMATDILIPDELPNKEFKSWALKLLKLKIQTVHNLIQEVKVDSN